MWKLHFDVCLSPQYNCLPSLKIIEGKQTVFMTATEFFTLSLTFIVNSVVFSVIVYWKQRVSEEALNILRTKIKGN